MNTLIKTNNVLTVCFLVITTPLWSLSSGNQDSDTPIPLALTSEVNSFGVRTSGEGEVFVSVVKLGELKTNHSYKLSLSMINRTQTEIAFDAVKPSCLCSKFFMEKGVIRSNKVFPVSVEFKTPPRSENGKFTFNASIFNAGKEVGLFSFVGALQDNLYVSPQLVFSVREQISSMAVPILVSEPMSLNSLELQVSESLGELQANIVERKGKGYLELEALGSSFEGHFATGDITIRDNSSGLEIATHVLMTRRLPVSVSPTVLKFRPESDDKMVAKCMVQVDRYWLTDKPSEIGFTFAIPEINVLVESKSLSRGYYKILLTINKEDWDSVLGNGTTENINMTTVIGGEKIQQVIGFFGD